jgi:hypothetical protein
MREPGLSPGPRPAPALRVVTCENGISKVRIVGASTLEDFDREPQAVQAAAVLHAAKVSAPAGSPVVGQLRSCGRRWRRDGAALRLLIALGTLRPDDTLNLPELNKALGRGWGDANHTGMELRKLWGGKWVVRHGTQKYYRYSLTPRGRLVVKDAG